MEDISFAGTNDYGKFTKAITIYISERNKNRNFKQLQHLIYT